MDDTFKVSRCTDIWRTIGRLHRPRNSSNHNLRWSVDTVDLCQTSGWGMTPAAATQTTFFSHLCLLVFPFLALLFFSVDLYFLSLAFQPSCLFFFIMSPGSLTFSSQLVSVVVAGGYPPQSCGYHSTPATYSSLFFPLDCIRIGTRHWRGPVDVFWPR